jgi:2-keto-4-pentenoate hydratase/2-oxohepta-3-ene-1,7-dioic acid hydratase in catechol pathway
MKIVVFGPERRVGALIGERVLDLNHGAARQVRETGVANALEQAATRLPPRLLAFIECGTAGLENAQRVIEQFNKIAPNDDRSEPKVVYNLSEIKLHAPWPERRIACVGGNYAAHLAGMWANRLGKTDVSIEQITQEAKKAGQWGFWKVPAEVAGPNDTIPFPKRVTYFDYEGEVAIIIGKRAKILR